MKQFRNLIVFLLALSLCITAVLSVMALDDETDITSSSSDATISAESETEEKTESEETVSESETETQSEPAVTSKEQSTVTTTSTKKSTTSSKSTKTKSSKKSNASSKAKKTSKEKKKTSGAVGKLIEHKTSSSYSNDDGYNTYPDSDMEDTESISGEWDSDKKILEEEKKPETHELTKNITNPKKQMQIWLFLPIVIGLACIGILIYVNIYLPKHPEKSWIYGGKSAKGSAKKTAKGGKHSGKNGVKPYKPGDFSKNGDDEEKTQKTDPYSADNFFNFDDDK